MEESQSKAFDDTIKFEKERAIASFNRLRVLMRLWQITKVAAVFAAITWYSPVVASFAEFSSRVLFNQHFVFLIGNAIIVSLVMLCRDSVVVDAERCDEVYDEYVKFGEAARAPPPPPQEEEAATVVECGGDKQQIVSVPVEIECDDVAAVIERATKQIRRFEMHSEALRREISVRPELRRSETESYREVLSSEAVEIEKLSNEEFRQTVDEFIHKYWRKPKLEGNES